MAENVSSIAGRVAWPKFGVHNLTKFGVNGFTESLRQEVGKRHVRVASSNQERSPPDSSRTIAKP